MIQDHTFTETAKARLELYTSLRVEVENRLERLEWLKSEEHFPKYQESDGAQHTAGKGDRLERATIRRMEYEQSTLPKIESSRQKMEEIEKEIDEITDPIEREILRLRYIDGNYCRLMPWRDVAYNLLGNDEEKDLKLVYRIHGKALISFAKILNKEHT